MIVIPATRVSLLQLAQKMLYFTRGPKNEKILKRQDVRTEKGFFSSKFMARKSVFLRSKFFLKHEQFDHQEK